MAVLGIASATALVPAPAFAAQPDAVAAGFSAHGALAVHTQLSGTKLQVTGNISLEELGNLVRLDMLSLSLPGLDPGLSALASSQLIPAGGYTVVFDQGKHGYTVWSTSKRTYYISTPGAADQTNNPVIGAAATIGSTSDFLHAFALAKPLKDYRAFSASVTLTGHGQTNGHPTTGIDFAIKRQERTGDPLDLHGNLQLADDLDEIPVRINANVQGSGGLPPSSMQLDLTSVDRSAPSAADFTVPAGYAKAAQLSDVFGKLLP
jgi:hypothetical protein